ncbi:MAG TPA: hypothetical protein VEY07_01150 [Thermoplasmata archaeon]|nr:hypothetical protein [Thermoplasmata archaeon]
MALMALLVAPALAAPVPASPAPLGTGNSQQWAYGGEKWVNVTILLPNATLTERAFFGWDVVFTATNTSATTQAWEAQRSMAGYYYLNYSATNSAGSLGVRGWETDTGFANLTTAASVTENGSSVPAVGLLNASFENAANLSERMAFNVTHGPFTGTMSAGLSIAGAAHGSVQFTPALGLVPLNVTSGSHWNSSAAFLAAGGWSAKYSVFHTPFNGSPASFSFNATGGVSANGSVALWGEDVGNVTLANGLSVPEIVLVWSGPFDDVDGVILIPHDFDFFGGGSHAWDHDGLATESVGTSDLDLRFDHSHHLAVVAAATAFGSAATNYPVATSGPTGPSPMASSSSPTVVQAQPESVPQAQQNSACLTGACAASATSHTNVGGVVAIAVIAAVIVGIVALVLVLRGRRGGRGPSPAAPTLAPPAGALGASPGPESPPPH